MLTNSLPHTRSGYAYRCHDTLRAQAAAGLRPEAVTRLGYPLTIGNLGAARVDVVDGIRYRRLLPPALAADPVARHRQHVDALSAQVSALSPRVLHATTPASNGTVTADVAGRHGLPWIYEVRGFPEETWASSRATGAEVTQWYRLTRRQETATMAAAAAVLTLSPTMAREIAARGVPADRIVVVPQAVDDAVLTAPVTDPERTRRSLGIPHGVPVVGTVTSVVPYEGLDRLIRAVALLAARGRLMHLLIVGDGTALPGLAGLARAEGVAGHVTFTGRVPRDRVPGLIDAMDAFAVPRRDDRVCRTVTPMKPLEALARAVPVVASDLPALTDLVRDGVSGLTVPASDEAWADALARVAEDAAGMRAMGAAGRAEVAATRTWQANAVLFAEVYSRLSR